MLSSHLCLDDWQLWKHSLAHSQAAPLPCVRSTEIVRRRREFITVAIRDYCRYCQKMLLATHGDGTERWEARQYLDDGAVGTSESVFWKKECISPMIIIVPDNHLKVYLSILNHSMEHVLSILRHNCRIDKFNHLWAMMPPYHAIAWFNKPYNQEMQWSGKEMKAVGSVIAPVPTRTLLNPSASQSIPFTEALMCVKN